MLSIASPLGGGGSGDYYLTLAQQEYYTKSVERPGEWFGKGAEVLRWRYAKRASKAEAKDWADENIKPVGLCSRFHFQGGAVVAGIIISSWHSKNITRNQW